MEKEKEHKHPPWETPKGGFNVGLEVYNSLTSTKVPFIPAHGKQIKWYICGPTVYDSSHLGHARNYLTFDIIRRILEEYFGYEVFAVMNITDVDDKIILKARRIHLFDTFVAANSTLNDTAKAELHKAWPAHIDSLKKKLDELIKKAGPKAKDDPEVLNGKERLDEAIANEAAVQKLLSAQGPLSTQEIYKLSVDALSSHLDSQLGGTVTDQKIFRDLASKYEAEYLQDMAKLGIRLPDVLTRVTEYIPEIIKMVDTIIKNGFAYESSGSVFFDTQAFGKSHHYGKLRPWQVGDKELQEDAEGSLSKGKGFAKRHDNDFALWKASKKGEPVWDSPWGAGRPGWHIECSAMASALLGNGMDIHGGGEDLAFPHHDNELAQSEAFHNCQQWVSYFLHAGHLHINGLKMSKSLKNFITIRQALEKYTARQIRFLFLHRKWNSVINYSVDALNDAVTKEKTFSVFFNNVRSIVNSEQTVVTGQNWGDRDVALNHSLLEAQRTLDAALKDNFDTPKALDIILELVSASNKYMQEHKERKAMLLRKVAVWVTKILKVFGIIPDADFGFEEAAGGSVGGESRHAVLAPLVGAIAQFRTAVRTAAREKKDPPTFFQICDKLRNDDLPPLGVQLEDEGLTPWRIAPPEQLLKEKEERIAKALEEKQSNLKKKIASLEGEVKKLREDATEPQHLYAAEYVVDANGLPTHYKGDEKKELTAQEKKKFEKPLAAHVKKHQQYKEKVQKNPNLLAEKEKDLQELRDQLSKLHK